jgi:hypothetical protein
MGFQIAHHASRSERQPFTVILSDRTQALLPMGFTLNGAWSLLGRRADD